MLIGRSFVAVDRDSLVHCFAVEIFFFAERLHHQLLQVTAKQQQTILVGQDHHVFLAAPVADVKPHQSQQHRRVLMRIGRARALIHRGRPG